MLSARAGIAVPGLSNTRPTRDRCCVFDASSVRLIQPHISTVTTFTIDEKFMPAILKYRLRYKIRCRHQHALDRVLARTAASAITRILIVSDGLSIPDQQQFTPLFENRRRIF